MTLRETLDEIQENNLNFMKKAFKSLIPLLIKSIITGGVLKYVLATRGFENMIIVAFVIVILALNKKK